MPRKVLLTSESVTEGHPDKVADQISDAVLDAILAVDPTARVACEALVTTGLACVAGEITTTALVPIPEIVREVIAGIGYTDPSSGFDARTCAVLIAIGRQSLDIALGVDDGGAGDQGMMFGYATTETPELMPLPIMLAHRLARTVAERRRSGALPWLLPDGKAQVTVAYEHGRPVRIQTVVISAQHAETVSTAELRRAVLAEVIVPVLPPELVDPSRLTVHINPTGRFVIGGPPGDAGLTGRKIIVDTYGGAARHGGGAFSGKDPSKVDRSAAYAARWVAKNIVAAGLAERCEVQVAYAIGVARPVSIMVETFGTSDLPRSELEARVASTFDLTPYGIIRDLDLLRPIYYPTAAYGHFGRTPGVDGSFTWEIPSRADALLSTELLRTGT